MSDAPSDKPSWITRLLIGAAVGAFYGALHLWFYEVSFVSLLAAAAGGAAFFSLIGVGSDYLAHRSFKTVLLGAVAGCVAGIVWWAVAAHGTSIFLAAGTGTIGGVIIIWLEL
jgi:hypothetical protein